MTTLTVNFFRGIKSATLELAPITLIAGHNAAGKSSVCAALAALLTQTPRPEGCKKNQAELLVNENASAGSIDLISDNSRVTILYPECSIDTLGTDTPLTASPVAAGLVSPVELPDRERAEYFSKLLKIDPSDAAIAEAVKPAGLSADSVAKLIGKIRGIGWDGAYKAATEAGSQLKGEWRAATGANYGSKLAAGWKPAGWVPKLAKADSASYAPQIAALKAERDGIVSTVAVDSARIEALQKQAAGLDDAKASAKLAASTVTDRAATLESLKKSAPELLTNESQPCPECSAPLVIRGGKIVTGTNVTAGQIAESKKASDAHYLKIRDAEKALAEAQRDATLAAGIVRDCEAASKAVAGHTATAPATTTRTAEQIDFEIRNLVVERDMIETQRKAAKIHESIEQNAVIVAALAPEGLRATALKEKIEVWNARLVFGSGAARWGVVTMDNDLNITYDDRPWVLLSESEKYRVRATVQIAAAGLDASDMLVFDGADILDSAGRNGLMRASLASGKPALVGMTFLDRANLPDISKKGNKAYWIENGEVVA